MDRISNLPDEIVCHVLSFLSTKEAALTSLLSNRWRNLFVFSPNLCFEYNDFGYRFSGLDIRRNFIDFLDRVLAVSGNLPIKKFSLNYRRLLSSTHTNRWICNVMSRDVLQHLHLNVSPRGVTSLPLEIFTCKTLVTLSLGIVFKIAMVPENASLPALKALFLESIRFSNHHCAFKALLSACPVLEELRMSVVNTKHCVVSCPTLQRLTLDYPISSSITFDTPSLAYLKYHDNLPKVYPIVNLDSLVEAKLTLFSSLDSTNHCNIENLIKGLRNVQILSLTTPNTMETLYTFLEAMPVFKNLFHLSIPSAFHWCCRALPLLMKNAPNLETLVIKGHLHDSIEPESVCMFILPCRVKVLEITLCGGTTISEQGQLKHILEILSCLELVKVRFHAADQEGRKQLTKDILNLPRLSKCKIQFDFIF